MTHNVLYTSVRSAMESICRILAFIGFGLFLFEALVSVGSILGRMAFSRGIAGDYELVSMASASAIALCLPYCELRRGHVFVDFFTLWAPQALKRSLDAIAAIVLAAVSFLLAWRTWDGLFEMHEYGETSMILGFPVWWSYVPLPVSFFLLGIAALLNTFLPNTEHAIHD